MRHQITEVPLVEKAPRRKLGGEGGKLQTMKEGGTVVEKIKKGVRKAKDVIVQSAKEVGKKEVKVAKANSHHLVEVGEELHHAVQSLKKGGEVKKVKELTDAQKLKAFEKSEEKREKKGEALAGSKSKLTNLAKNRERMLSNITDTTPAKARKSRAKKAEVVIVEEVVVKKPRAKKQSLKEGGVVAKKPSAWLAHVKAHRAKHGGTYIEAMKNAKATYKK